MEQTTVKASLSYIEGISVRSAFTSFTVKLPISCSTYISSWLASQDSFFFWLGLTSVMNKKFIDNQFNFTKLRLRHLQFNLFLFNLTRTWTKLSHFRGRNNNKFSLKDCWTKLKHLLLSEWSSFLYFLFWCKLLYPSFLTYYGCF